MDLGYIYDMIQFISNKHQSGYISPTEFQNAANLAQKQYQDELIDVLIGWDASNRKRKYPIGNTQQVIKKLSPFIVRLQNEAVSPNGHLTKPADLQNLLSIRTANDTNRIWRTEEDRVFSHVSSVIDSPSVAPIFTEYDTYYQIYPVGIGAVNMSYIKIAPEVVYATTLDANGRPIYNQGASTQFLWEDLEMTNIIIRILFMFGISIQANQLIQYYGSVKNDGQ